MYAPTASPVLSPTKHGTPYLEIVLQDDGKVRVQRTEAGKTLNKFWTAWLRHLILGKSDPRGGFAVELRGAAILVSASVSSQALMETVRAFAQQIVPIANPPIHRLTDSVTSRQACWNITSGVDLQDCLQSVQLPQPAQLQAQNGHIVLTRGSKNPFKIGELCLIVEHHVALHCRS